MKKLISFMHISLDGFVSGPKGEMDWIHFDQELFDHVGERIRQNDMALYGRVTFEMMESYWPEAGNKPEATKHEREHSKWYNAAHKVVLSRSLNQAALSNTTVISDDLSENVNKLKGGKGTEILLFGSPTTTHELIQLNLIDGYWLFVNPVVLGEGVPLFKNITGKINLNLLSSRQFSCGVTELNYDVIR